MIISFVTNISRFLQVKLDQPVSEPPSPRTLIELNNGDTAANLANNIHALRQECARLKQQLESGKKVRVLAPITPEGLCMKVFSAFSKESRTKVIVIVKKTYSAGFRPAVYVWCDFSEMDLSWGVCNAIHPHLRISGNIWKKIVSNQG